VSRKIQCTLEPLLSIDDPCFEEFYAIYVESIDIREQKSRPQIVAMVGRPDYSIMLAKKGGLTIGFSIFFRSLKGSICLLEYMAVRVTHRGGGVGAALFRRNIHDAASPRGQIPVLLEVDSDVDHSSDGALIRRRQQFYRRLGCRRIAGLSYLLPLPMEDPPPSMDLMIYVSPLERVIDKSTLSRWLSVIYEEVYQRSPGDARISRMLESVGDLVILI
jgi:GNAT superfamily N-acetyltransferase